MTKRWNVYRENSSSARVKKNQKNNVEHTHAKLASIRFSLYVNLMTMKCLIGFYRLDLWPIFNSRRNCSHQWKNKWCALCLWVQATVSVSFFFFFRIDWFVDSSLCSAATLQFKSFLPIVSHMYHTHIHTPLLRLAMEEGRQLAFKCVWLSFVFSPKYINFVARLSTAVRC